MKKIKRDEAIEMEQLVPQVLVEEILERLEVKSLVRFTSVSKQWNSMIKSKSLASRHLIRTQSRYPPDIHLDSYRCLETLELHLLLKLVNITKPDRRRSIVVSESCDGVVCVYDFKKVIYVFNPATRWCRFLPRAKIQQINHIRENLNSNSIASFLGFGKDIMTSTYKMVWLYNSLEINLDGQTTCEVFDFTGNTWRHVTGSPHRISDQDFPVHIDGSLYWLTPQLDGKTMIICFDLHTEVFQVMSEILFADAWTHRIIMFSLHNHLCVSEMKHGSRDIWSLNSHKVWEKTYSFSPTFISAVRCYGNRSWFPISPVTVFNKNRFLYVHPTNSKKPSLLISLLAQDTKKDSSYRPGFFERKDLDQAISFIPSLISI